MPTPKKATDQELLLSYRETESVWATGKKFGMCGQSAHERLKKMGAIKPYAGRKRTPEFCAMISALGRGRKLSPEACANIASAKRGEKNPNWEGGRVTHPQGYIYIKCPNHPYKNAMGYVYEHRIVLEEHLKRILLPREVVHHINRDKKDNRIENLKLFPSNAEHTRHHDIERRAQRNGFGEIGNV